MDQVRCAAETATLAHDQHLQRTSLLLRRQQHHNNALQRVVGL
jgi:hypothetical protein